MDGPFWARAILLVRHGETACSITGHHTGRTDLPLTARGEDEARELAQRLEPIAFAHVLTSPLQRARQTCEFAGLGAKAEIEQDLVEWDYGDYEGQRSVDIFASNGRTGIFFRMVARMAKCLSRLQAGQIA